jgi:IS6 family transposase
VISQDRRSTTLDCSSAGAWHHTEQYVDNRIECDHSRFKARLRPMRGLKQERNAGVIICRRRACVGAERSARPDEPAVEESARRRVAVAFDELAIAI